MQKLCLSALYVQQNTLHKNAKFCVMYIRECPVDFLREASWCLHHNICCAVMTSFIYQNILPSPWCSNGHSLRHCWYNATSLSVILLQIAHGHCVSTLFCHRGKSYFTCKMSLQYLIYVSMMSFQCLIYVSMMSLQYLIYVSMLITSSPRYAMWAYQKYGNVAQFIMFWHIAKLFSTCVRYFWTWSVYQI